MTSCKRTTARDITGKIIMERTHGSTQTLHSNFLFRIISSLLFLSFITICTQNAFAVTKLGTNFDHFTTNFPLDGAHKYVSCSSCHKNGIFKGTPRTCSQCHSMGSRIATTRMPANHVRVPRGVTCESCHKSKKWGVVRMDHSVVSGSCASCHDGRHSGITGKSVNHLKTRSPCEDCHKSTRSWQGARFVHDAASTNCKSCHYTGGRARGKNAGHIVESSNDCGLCHNQRKFNPITRMDHGVVSSNCVSCHNNPNASKMRGKNIGHILESSNNCALCHSQRSFAPIRRMDHGVVNTGNCISCHNNPNASKMRGKNPGHISTTQNCDQCHSGFNSWNGASGHGSNIAGRCISCHSGQTSGQSKPSNHFITNMQCDICHSSNQAGGFRSPRPYYSNHSSSPSNHNSYKRRTCTNCHRTNSPSPIGRQTRPDLYPACAGCHASDYPANEHGGRSVSTNRNCGDSGCHSTNTFNR